MITIDNHNDARFLKGLVDLVAEGRNKKDKDVVTEAAAGLLSSMSVKLSTDHAQLDDGEVMVLQSILMRAEKHFGEVGDLASRRFAQEMALKLQGSGRAA